MNYLYEVNYPLIALISIIIPTILIVIFLLKYRNSKIKYYLLIVTIFFGIITYISLSIYAEHSLVNNLNDNSNNLMIILIIFLLEIVILPVICVVIIIIFYAKKKSELSIAVRTDDIIHK